MENYIYKQYKSIQLKMLTTEKFLRKQSNIILNHMYLIHIYTYLNNSKTQLNRGPHIKNVYDKCKTFFFLKNCSSCHTHNLPKNMFCIHCGHLLNINTKYKIDLGEYYI